MTDGFEDQYQRMSDDELLEIAASGDDLVAEARRALDVELDRRNLRGELAAKQSAAVVAAQSSVDSDSNDEEPEHAGALLWEPQFMDPSRLPVVSSDEGRDQVVIARFRDLVPAQLAQGALQSAGIDAQLLDDNMIRLDWFASHAIGGVRLVVAREDAEPAAEILQAPTPQITDVGEPE